MFAYLIGTVAEVTPEKLVLEVNRIGYNIRIPASAVSLLPPVGEEVKIYTYTSVREDAVTLFGFLRKDDLEMYRQLINVSGIGPKAGLSILSALSADEIRLAVLSQDEKAIAKAPGISRKMAQKIILELKDRISLEDAFAGGGETVQAAPAAGNGSLSRARQEAVEALTALGYSASEALRAVKAVEREDMDVEELLKAALKKMY